MGELGGDGARRRGRGAQQSCQAPPSPSTQLFGSLRDNPRFKTGWDLAAL